MPTYYPNRKSMTLAQRRRASYLKKAGVRNRINASNRIKRAYRGYKSRARPARYISGDNFVTKKVRVQKDITYNALKTFSSGGGKHFVIYFAPWANVSTSLVTSSGATGFGYANLLYSPELADMFSAPRAYNLFRMKAVYATVTRPKCYIDHISDSDTRFLQYPDNYWGMETLHTRQQIQADATTGVVQPSLTAVNYGRTIVHPSSWDECIDDGSRFKMNRGHTIKKIWKPASKVERDWRFTTGVELEHSTGGIMIAMKDSVPIPSVVGPAFDDNQVMFTVTAWVYMDFKVKI